MGGRRAHASHVPPVTAVWKVGARPVISLNSTATVAGSPGLLAPDCREPGLFVLSNCSRQSGLERRPQPLGWAGLATHTNSPWKEIHHVCIAPCDPSR
jgi:hypothetical protein